MTGFHSHGVLHWRGAVLLAVAPLAFPRPVAPEGSAPFADAAGRAAIASAFDAGEMDARLQKLRAVRNSATVLQSVDSLYLATDALEQAMVEAYGDFANTTEKQLGSASAGQAGVQTPPGNFHGHKSHAYYVGAISEAHPVLEIEQVQSIVASEWYHPGLTAQAVWCTENCGAQFPLARRLDANSEEIRREVEEFWRHPDAVTELHGVGSHTTQFDKLIAGNGTWVDVRLWRGRAFNRRLCEQHFRVICGIVEASPEVWTNPWSHVLLSVLLEDSWVPFHQGHTNGQLTYHFPVNLPARGSAELAVVDRGGSLKETGTQPKGLSHPEERTVRWREGSTLVFDDSFTHAVRFRKDDAPLPHVAKDDLATPAARIVLLMRGWHPELPANERAALRDFIRRGGEERPVGYELLPISDSVFSL